MNPMQARLIARLIDYAQERRHIGKWKRRMYAALYGASWHKIVGMK